MSSPFILAVLFGVAGILLGLFIARINWQPFQQYGAGLLVVYVALGFLICTAIVSVLGNQGFSEQLGIIFYFLIILGFILLVIRNIRGKKDNSENNLPEE